MLAGKPRSTWILNVDDVNGGCECDATDGWMDGKNGDDGWWKWSGEWLNGWVRETLYEVEPAGQQASHLFCRYSLFGQCLLPPILLPT